MTERKELTLENYNYYANILNEHYFSKIETPEDSGYEDANYFYWKDINEIPLLKSEADCFLTKKFIIIKEHLLNQCLNDNDLLSKIKDSLVFFERHNFIYWRVYIHHESKFCDFSFNMLCHELVNADNNISYFFGACNKEYEINITGHLGSMLFKDLTARAKSCFYPNKKIKKYFTNTELTAENFLYSFYEAHIEGVDVYENLPFFVNKQFFSDIFPVFCWYEDNFPEYNLLYEDDKLSPVELLLHCQRYKIKDFMQHYEILYKYGFLHGLGEEAYRFVDEFIINDDNSYDKQSLKQMLLAVKEIVEKK